MHGFVERPEAAPVPSRWGGTVGVPAVLLAGAALDWACRAHPGLLPFWAPWEFSWPEFLACALALLFYTLGLIRTTPAARPHWGRSVSYIGGVLLIYAVLQTHFDYMAQHMFTLTRVQHLSTHHLGPFLMVLGRPGRLLWRGMPAPLRRLLAHPIWQRVLAVLQQPVIAGALFVGLIFVWLIPHVLFRAMVDARLYAIMNWSMLVDGLLFWALVLDDRASPPARLSRSGRLLLAFLVQWPQVAGGAIIGFVGHVLYPYYGLCGRVYPAIGAQTDQQIGAFLIWFAGGMMSAIAALMILRTIWAEEEAQARRTIPGWDKGANRTGVARPLL